MSTKTQIANMAMTRMGEAILTDVDADGTNPANVFNAGWDIAVAEMLNIGPENGWKFAMHSINCVGVDNSAITVFADYSGTVTGTVKVTSVAHALLTGDTTVITGTTSYNDTYVATKIDADNYYITATFVADDATGTSQWTSTKFAYRFPVPTSIRVTETEVGGSELTDWNQQGQYILTNLEDTEVNMDYILVLDDLSVANFPPHFVDVMWRKMSVHMAYDLIQNKAIGDGWLQELEQIYLPRAIGMDNRAQFVKEESNSWAEAGRTNAFIE